MQMKFLRHVNRRAFSEKKMDPAESGNSRDTQDLEMSEALGELTCVT